MNRYVTPNDNGIMGNTDSESIQNAVNYAVKSGIGRVVIPRTNNRTEKNVWDIDKAIILASDMEIVLDNCTMRQADGALDNVFRSHYTTEEATEKSAQLHDVRIVGKGNAVIDGGVHNGLTEFNTLTDGRPHITRNNMLLFMNIRNFVIENIFFRNQRWWAINLIFAEYGRLSNLRFYCECDQPNLDGIDLRDGCHDIIIENITGTVGDDLVALSAIGANVFTSDLKERYKFSIEGKARDMHDITIRNVIGTSADCGVITMRSTDGRKQYNITIDNVHDVDNGAIEEGKIYPEYPKYKIGMDIRKKMKGNSPYALLRIGQYGYFAERPNNIDEVYGITATNLYARGGVAVMINVCLKDSYFGNIHADNDVDYVITTKSGRISQRYGAHISNTIFENIYYDNKDNTDGTAFDFDINAEMYTLENVIINRAFVGNCQKIFNVRENGNVIFRDVYGKYVEKQNGEIIVTE